jgi:hypothetical protein
MLQFLKESQNIATEVENKQNPVQSAEGTDESQQYLTVPDKKSQLRKSTYLVAGLFLIGIAGLFFMIKNSTPSTASASEDTTKKAEQAQIETAISKLTGIRTQMFSSLEKIVTKFYEFSDVEQVNVGDLSKNPFKEDNYMGLVKPDEAQSRFSILKEELELLSIMSTERGYCCMINDKILYEGDSIKGLKITKITSNVVSLSSGDMSMTLKLSEEF